MFRCERHKDYDPTCGPPSKGWDYDFSNVSLATGGDTCEGCPNCWRSYASQTFKDLRALTEVSWDLRRDVVDLETENECLKNEVDFLHGSRSDVLHAKSVLAEDYRKLLKLQTHRENYE